MNVLFDSQEGENPAQGSLLNRLPTYSKSSSSHNDNDFEM